MTNTKRNFNPHVNSEQRKAFPCMSLEKMREEEERRRAEEAGRMKWRTDMHGDYQQSNSNS